jgi:hypothetical protein
MASQHEHVDLDRRDPAADVVDLEEDGGDIGPQLIPGSDRTVTCCRTTQSVAAVFSSR